MKLTPNQKQLVKEYARKLIKENSEKYFAILSDKLDKQADANNEKFDLSLDEYGRYVISPLNWENFKKFAAKNGFEYGLDYYEIDKNGNQIY